MDIVAASTGVLLNNEIDDFSAKPGVPNAYGLVGGEANAIEPGKRPLSSMIPTIVFKDAEPFLVTGSPGGSRIITTVAQIVMNVVDHGMNIAAATAAPRVERGLGPDSTAALEARGHRLAVKWAMGSTQSAMRTGAGLFGASDPRRPGGAHPGVLTAAGRDSTAIFLIRRPKSPRVKPKPLFRGARPKHRA